MKKLSRVCKMCRRIRSGASYACKMLARGLAFPIESKADRKTREDIMWPSKDNKK